MCQHWGTYSCCITAVHRESSLLVALQAIAACSVFFQVPFPPLLLCRIPLVGTVPFGLAATLAGVPSDDLAAVTSEMEGSTRAGTIGLSDLLGIRALIKTTESMSSGESWTIYIKSPHTCWSHLPSFRKANHFSLSDDFRSVSPSFGCCDCFNNLILACQFFYSLVSFFFLDVRTSSVHRRYLQ